MGGTFETSHPPSWQTSLFRVSFDWQLCIGGQLELVFSFQFSGPPRHQAPPPASALFQLQTSNFKLP